MSASVANASCWCCVVVMLLSESTHRNCVQAAQVEGGLHFSCFLDGSGKRLYACGRGDYGSLGITLAQAEPGYLENVPRRVPLVYEPAAPVANPKENCIIENDIDESQQPEIAQISCG